MHTPYQPVATLLGEIFVACAAGTPTSAAALLLRLTAAGATILPLPQAVQDSDALRAAVEEVQPESVALNLRLTQSKPLYEAFKALRCVEATWIWQP